MNTHDISRELSRATKWVEHGAARLVGAVIVWNSRRCHTRFYFRLMFDHALFSRIIFATTRIGLKSFCLRFNFCNNWIRRINILITRIYNFRNLPACAVNNFLQISLSIIDRTESCNASIPNVFAHTRNFFLEDAIIMNFITGLDFKTCCTTRDWLLTCNMSWQFFLTSSMPRKRLLRGDCSM